MKPPPPPLLVVALCLLAALVPPALAVSAYDSLVQQGQPLGAANFILHDPPNASWLKWKHQGNLPAADPSITACESELTGLVLSTARSRGAAGLTAVSRAYTMHIATVRGNTIVVF